MLPLEIYKIILSYIPYTTRYDLVCQAFNIIWRNNVNLSMDGSKPLRLAASRGLILSVKYLLSQPSVDPKALQSEALRKASANGHTEVVRCLLTDKRSDPQARDSQALTLAAKNGHSEVVSLLLTDRRANPNAGHGCVLRSAIKYNHVQIADHLISGYRISNIHEYAIEAVIYNRPIILLLFINYHVNIHNTRHYIKYATEEEYADIIKLILAHVEITAAIHKECHSIATQRGRHEIASLFKV